MPLNVRLSNFSTNRSRRQVDTTQPPTTTHFWKGMVSKQVRGVTETNFPFSTFTIAEHGVGPSWPSG
jgi:hypothetical protein